MIKITDMKRALQHITTKGNDYLCELHELPLKLKNINE
jgi:hypothetical protein